MSDRSNRTLITDSPPNDNSYAQAGKTAPDRHTGPDVVSDSAKAEYTGETAKGGDPSSDAQLELDEKEAINTDNILPHRTRAQDPESEVGRKSYVDPEETDVSVERNEKVDVVDYEEA